jgi:hypothetical protein
MPRLALAATACAAAIACVIGLTVTGAPSAVAVGGGFQGKFENLCGYTHTNQDDAILFPGQVGASSHLHDYVSNPSANANSTATSLRAGSTNCVNSLDFASYWAPELFNGSTPVHTASDTVYYLTNGKKNVQPYPFGFKEIAGNAKAQNPSQAQDILWAARPACQRCPRRRTARPAPNCTSGSTSPTAGTACTWTAPTTSATSPTASTACARPASRCRSRC